MTLTALRFKPGINCEITPFANEGGWVDGDNGSLSGSAYIFDLGGNELSKITASNSAAGDQFGISVGVGSGRIVVGANLDDGTGSAYIYETPLNATHVLDILD